MQEIEVKENPVKVKVCINGTPELKNIPKEKLESILAALELKISDTNIREHKKADKYRF